MVRRESYGLAVQKWAEKPLGRPQSPLVCPIGHYETDAGQPLKYHKAFGLLVIGAVGDQPCLTALGLIGISCCVKQTDGSIPLRGRQPKSDEKPATDQMPKSRNSVAAQWNFACVRLDKSGVQPEGGWRFFAPFLGGQKWGRRRQNSAEGRCPPIRRNPANPPKSTLSGRRNDYKSYYLHIILRYVKENPL